MADKNTKTEDDEYEEIDISQMGKTELFWHRIEVACERFIFESRWFLLPLFLGLAVSLLMYSIQFVFMVADFSWNIFQFQKNELLLMILTFVDKVLVGGLVVMVIIGGYENSVGKLSISKRQRKISWLGKLDSTTLKIKLATAIVSISSVHLLKMFLETSKYDDKELGWTTGIHIVIVLTTFILIAGDKLRGKH